MFKCVECGNKYDQKPDFCDCGNDVFEEITEVKALKEGRKNNFSKTSFFSWLFFIACIIISIVVLLFFPQINEQKTTDPIKKQTKQIKNVPDINSIWTDSVKEEEPIIEQVKEVIFKPKQPDKPVEKPVVKQQPKQTQTTQTKKTQPAQTTTKVQTKTKPQAQSRNVTVPKSGKNQTSSYDYEVINYRTALRQRLFSNLDLYKIEGSGSCCIEFSINENGKLVNRNFVSQSDNKSVNDEVYKMLMRTPQFTPPPESYANKLIKMMFKLTSDSYEIKYLN